jgi:Putative restriction endonuclease
MTQAVTALASASPALPVILKAERGEVHVPPGIADLEAFRRWLRSGTFPEKLRICYLDDVLWVDLSPEELFSHNAVKSAVACALHRLAREGRGRYVLDGMHFSHLGANFSTMPDGAFVSYAAFQTGRVRRTPDVSQRDVIEFVGTPDMVLEVVSDSSVQKDVVTLPALYQAAQIPEFWRIDARAELRFEILRLTPAGYVATQLADGWWRSDTFGHDFRLVQGADPLGDPRFILETR